jgi:hypothetical protein
MGWLSVGVGIASHDWFAKEFVVIKSNINIKIFIRFLDNKFIILMTLHVLS